jgi:hypothetical protein
MALHLDAETVIKIMTKVAEADIFREESYICPPTVMHVVRLLQANPDDLKKNKYKVDYPIYCLEKPIKVFCNIGFYGYLMSVLEQYGFIYRFYLTYCTENALVNLDTNPNVNSKCYSKLKKYLLRITNAVDIQKAIGGRKRKSCKLKNNRKCNRKSRKKAINH